MRRVRVANWPIRVTIAFYFFRPFRGSVPPRSAFPRLAPWAGGFRRFAAWVQVWGCRWVAVGLDFAHGPFGRAAFLGHAYRSASPSLDGRMRASPHVYRSTAKAAVGHGYGSASPSLDGPFG